MERSNKPRPENSSPSSLPAVPSTDPFLDIFRSGQRNTHLDFIQAQLNTFFSGVSPTTELCNLLTQGMTLSNSEGRDWRSLLWSTWHNTELSALDKQRPDTIVPQELRALAHFDTFVLPRFSTLLALNEKSAFMEFGIAHLAWVGYEGFVSEHHTETVCHATHLIRHALPDAPEMLTISDPFIERLRRVLSSVISAATRLDSNESRSRNYDAIDELLRLPLPWSNLGCADALCELYWSMRYELDRCMDPAERVLLADISSREPQAPSSENISTGDRELDGPAEFTNENDEVDQYIAEFSEQDVGHTNSAKALASTLIDTILKMPLDPENDFVREFLNKTSLSDPTWARGLQTLERVNPYEFDAITYRLLHTASQSPYGARTLLALALMDHTRAWRSVSPFLITLRDVSSTLQKETRNGITSQIRHVISHYSYLVGDVVGRQPQPPVLNRVAESMCRMISAPNVNT
jgi:hypothetical protein